MRSNAFDSCLLFRFFSMMVNLFSRSRDSVLQSGLRPFQAVGQSRQSQGLDDAGRCHRGKRGLSLSTKLTWSVLPAAPLQGDGAGSRQTNIVRLPANEEGSGLLMDETIRG